MNVRSTLHICTGKVWSDLPSEVFVVHVADLVVRTYGWTSTSALVTFREQKKYVCCNAML